MMNKAFLLVNFVLILAVPPCMADGTLVSESQGSNFEDAVVASESVRVAVEAAVVQPVMEEAEPVLLLIDRMGESVAPGWIIGIDCKSEPASPACEIHRIVCPILFGTNNGPLYLPSWETGAAVCPVPPLDSDWKLCTGAETC